MNAKEMLYRILTNLRGLEVKGEDNVLILAQVFVDTNKLMEHLINEEQIKEAEPVKEKADKK